MVQRTPIIKNIDNNFFSDFSTICSMLRVIAAENSSAEKEKLCSRKRKSYIEVSNSDLVVVGGGLTGKHCYSYCICLGVHCNKRWRWCGVLSYDVMCGVKWSIPGGGAPWCCVLDERLE